MRLIIDIPEDYYKAIKEIPIEQSTADMLIIRNGTPLPKGHGRLIDADETLKRHCVDLCKEKPSCYEDCLIYDLFHLAPTIIEADGGDADDGTDEHL